MQDQLTCTALSDVESQSGLDLPISDSNRIEGMVFSDEFDDDGEVLKGTVQRFVLEIRMNPPSAVSGAVASQSENSHGDLFGVKEAMKGWAVIVRCAQDSGMDHIFAKHLNSDVRGFVRVFPGTEFPVVIFRTPEGLCMFGGQIANEHEFRAAVTDQLETHADEGCERVACTDMDVQLIKVDKNHGAIAQIFEPWNAVYEWAERCYEWYAAKYIGY